MRSRKVGLFTALSAVLLSYSATTSAIELEDSLESTIGVVNGDLLDHGVLGRRGLPVAGDLVGDHLVAGRLLGGGVLGGGDLPVVGDVLDGGLPVVGRLSIVESLLDGDDLPVVGDLLDR